MQIPVQQLIALFRRMYDEHWRYVWGKAETGCVDCSGAFVWAYRQFGKTIAHGSNTIARQYVAELLPVSAASPGMAAFKKLSPGANGYSLPEKFRPGGAAYNGDLGDYYHIGLVDETGRYVLNAQGTQAGFTRTKISKWACVGKLKAVQYDKNEEAKPMQDYIVTAPNGGLVNLRENPNERAAILTRVRSGEKVQAVALDDPDWMRVDYAGKIGYMMSRYLVPASESYHGSITLNQSDVEKAQQAIQTLASILGGGAL